MRAWPTPVGLACLLALSGCGGGGSGDTAAKTFRPLSYDYLTKLRLNVGDVRIEDQTPPATGSTDLDAKAPTPPAQAMRRMAEDRLLAAGNTGTAVFTIDQASITGQPGGTLDGTLAAHLDIIGSSGGHNGYAEAHVSRQLVPGSGGDGLKSQLYSLTGQMMADMNVELEYQVRRTLGDWLLDASGAPVGATVEEQSLAPAGGHAAGTAPGTVARDGQPAATSSTPPDAQASAPSAPATTGAAPAASNSVGAPTQLAPTAGAVPSGAPMQDEAPASGPTQLAPPVLTPSPSAGAAATTTGAATPAATAPAGSPPPGFLRLPNGYLAPVGSARSAPATQGSGPLNLAPAANSATPSGAAPPAGVPGGY